MKEFWLPVKRVIQYTLFVLLLSVIGWLLLPGKVFWQGFLLGTFTSLLNGLLLLKKTLQAGEAAKTGGRAKGTGMLQRFATAAFAVYLAAKFPELFSWAGVIAGLVVIQFFSFIVFYFQYYKKAH